MFIEKVAIENFRSIAGAEVALGPLTFLVGANGTGKSTFLDGLRLIADALNTSLDHALRERGGVKEVRRRSSGHPTHLGVRVSFSLAGSTGTFAFQVSARPRGDYAVSREVCRYGGAFYEVHDGQVQASSATVVPPASTDRLYLVNAAGLPAFRPVFDALSRMGFYNINPAQIRALQSPDKGDLLTRDGRNLASVVARMERTSPDRLRRIQEYLKRVVLGVEGVSHVAVGHMETLEFRQRVEGAPEPWRFPAINMSDGTLRAAAILFALFQAGPTEAVPLVGIEEPETALHPAAAGVLRDCLFEASSAVQVIVTSHSADLLDDPRVPAEMIRWVEAPAGNTRIADLDEASRSALRDRLYTAGELLRMNQLGADDARGGQLRLFGDEA